MKKHFKNLGFAVLWLLFAFLCFVSIDFIMTGMIRIEIPLRICGSMGAIAIFMLVCTLIYDKFYNK